MYTLSIGKSVNGSKIIAEMNFRLTLPYTGDFTLIVGGIHGDEKGVVPILQDFITNQLNSGNISRPVCIISVLNPDGYNLNSRYNANGVDLNRNFQYNWREDRVEHTGILPLSEPESKALADLITSYHPSVVISLHGALSEIDADGEQSYGPAEVMYNCLSVGEKTMYRLRHKAPDEVQACVLTGSLGQWCGYGLKYINGKRPVMITLELPYTHEGKGTLHPLPKGSFEIAKAVWANKMNEYTSQVIPSVHKMLKAVCESGG